MSLTTQEIREHYRTQRVRDTIMRVSNCTEGSRAGMKFIPNAYQDKATGEIKDSMDWYNMRFSPFRDKTKLNLANSRNYTFATNECRTIYWTLNVFKPAIYDIKFKDVEKGEGPAISRRNTVGYTFGVDIDREHGNDIHNPETKAAVEAMAQFFSDKFRKHAPNSVYVAYSGGGIYVMVHHEVFAPYFNQYKDSEEWESRLISLLDSFDAVIGDIRDEFFKLHPEHVGKTKPDQLNGSQRVFKTLYSVHKSLDYAVIPLDPKNVYIDFKKATVPLKDDILDLGDKWYIEYDKDNTFMEYLKPYIEVAYKKQEKARRFNNMPNVIENSAIPITDMNKWAPCMRNLYNMPSCGEGRTRALAIFSSFLGQIGLKEETAKGLFQELATRWGAEQSNIFESYFGIMKVPSCASLTSNDNRGFPKGVSIKSLCVCKPDIKCMTTPSPRFYTDTAANVKRLLTPKPERVKAVKPKTEKIKAPTKRLSKKGQALRSRLIAEAEQDGSRVIINPAKPEQAEQKDSIVTSVEGMAEFLNSEEEVTDKIELNSKNDSEAAFKAQRLKANRDSFEATEHTELKGAMLDFKNALI